MTATDNRTYYDAFATGYDDDRNVGYHKLIDDQAAELVRRVGEGKDVLEVGCGTGLILERVAGFARSARGIDLSPGMLEHARARGLDVQEGSATELPFDDESFDVAYSFKVLAHIPAIDRALSEMSRVVRPGGHLVFDVYNSRSLRYLIKKVFGPKNTSQTFDEAAISTRFESPDEAKRGLPPKTRFESAAGIRVITAHPAMCRIPLLGAVTQKLEWALMDGPLAGFGGFYVLTLERTA